MSEFLTQYTMFSGVEQFLVIGVIVLISQIIYATIGFGSGMFAISIMAFLYGNLEFVVPFFTVLCLPTEAAITYKDRKLINLKSMWSFLAIIIPALFVGSLLLKNSDNEIYLIILGFIIITLALYTLFERGSSRFSFKQYFWVPIFGSIAGVIGALFGMAGPPLIFYFKHKKMNKREFRIALLSIFSVMTIFKLLFYTILKIITFDIIMTSLFALPFALVGLFIGNRFHDLFPERLFKVLTSIALAVSGVIIIIKNLF